MTRGDNRQLTFRLVCLALACTFLVACGDESNSPSTADVPKQAVTPTGSSKNTPPTIRGIAPKAAVVGLRYEFRPQVSDADGDPLTFSATGLPASFGIDPQTGVISGVPGDSDVARYDQVTISVSDGVDSTSLAVGSIEVLATAYGTAMLSWLPPLQNTDGSPLLDLSGYRIRFGQDPDALGLSVNAANPGIASYMVEGLPPGTWYFSVSAISRSGVESAGSEPVAKTIT